MEGTDTMTGPSLAFSVTQDYCHSYYGALALRITRLLQKSGTETASALWNICQTTHSDPWQRAHGHLLQRYRCLSLKLRRRLLAIAILRCNYLRMKCLMHYLERCSHTQARHKMAIMKGSWVSRRKWQRNPASHVVTELGGNKGKGPSGTLFLCPCEPLKRWCCHINKEELFNLLIHL